VVSPGAAVRGAARSAPVGAADPAGRVSRFRVSTRRPGCRRAAADL